MNTCDDVCCWLCSMPTSFCNCEFSDSSWSRSTSRESFNFARDGHEKRSCPIDERSSLGTTLEDPDLESDDVIQPPGRWSLLAGAVTQITPKDVSDATQWQTPGTEPPPDSSSPLGLLGADSSPLWTDPGPQPLPLSHREDAVTRARPVFWLSRGNSGEQPSVKGQRLSNDLVDSNASVFPTTTSTTRFPSCTLAPEFHTRQSGSSMPAVSGDATQGSLEQWHFAKHGICAFLTPRTNKDLNLSGKLDGIDRVSTCQTAKSTSATEGGSSKLPFIVPAPCVGQAMHDGRLKRRRSSTTTSPKPKKVKLDRTLSRIFCAGDASEPKYQATEPASLRRAHSLRSEISACSEVESTSDSLFYPSPLSGSTSKPCPDECPPTVRNTPLPDSVDYARSRANPLARTIPVCRQRSLNAPTIPPVPIIAPPQEIGPTYVHCAEDQAIDRLKALLHRERMERETDGLHVQDKIRADRLKVKYPIELAVTRRDSASTTDTSDGGSRWEEESTLDSAESQESQLSIRTVRILPVQGQHRFIDRETWFNAFGIGNDLRKEITEWILKKLPKKPKSLKEPSRDWRQLGSNLYDQLTNSPQTRFHAAQLFLRYFRLPEKVEFWRDVGKHDCLEGEKDIWDLAVACIALGVKLHRDCLPPLHPVFAAEFLELAPHPMTHAGLECAQRDIMYTLQCLLGSCTPQDVLDEMWIALPTLRKATTPISNGWTVVQRVVWDKLFELLLEPDILQYPVTLLTAAALVDGLVFSLARQFRMEGEAKGSPLTPAVSECAPDDLETTSWQIYYFEAKQLVDDVILDIRDVLELSEMELNECRTWLSYVGEK